METETPSAVLKTQDIMPTTRHNKSPLLIILLPIVSLLIIVAIIWIALCSYAKCNSAGTSICIFGKCKCKNNWMGDKCDTGEKCKNVECGENGKCDSNTGTCKCNQGWYGDKCDQISCSSPGACINGTCQSNNICKCNTGWSGTRCDQPDKCQGVDCGVNGTCDPSDGSCKCNSGWLGDKCDKPITYNYVADTSSKGKWDPLKFGQQGIFQCASDSIDKNFCIVQGIEKAQQICNASPTCTGYLTLPAQHYWHTGSADPKMKGDDVVQLTNQSTLTGVQPAPNDNTSMFYRKTPIAGGYNYY